MNRQPIAVQGCLNLNIEESCSETYLGVRVRSHIDNGSWHPSGVGQTRSRRTQPAIG